MSVFKFVTLVLVTICANFGLSYYEAVNQSHKTENHMAQLNEPVRDKLLIDHSIESGKRLMLNIGMILVWVIAYADFIKRKFTPVIVGLLLLTICGCRRPFEPIKLEMINPTEEGFLLPKSNPGEQSSAKTEDYYKKNMVFTQEVKIPQKWVQKGYETMGYNGEWQDDAVLIKVDRSPVTREWTADPSSGTSDKNEAIWVMTSDQVEFSTGWTCTTRIDNRDAAAKFLSNYPNGSLATVMDQEVRAKIQSTFGLAVTDLPMDTLRKGATPVIVKTTTEVSDFFKERGITVTNLGITGGFVYKDPKIVAKMVEVFTAEQEKSIAMAKNVAQEETNKTIQLEADAKAKATLTVKQAEADAIKLVADAKAYEIEKAQENKEIYLELKKLELDLKRLEQWDGKYPVYYMGGQEDLLIQMPTMSAETK